ncbi:gp24 [Klebsiella pneumoniae]|uniref:Gp24 n=1 Tax=Klebsiella pneumoniae TaxID=573 RepID=A0A377WGH4_KLEPN|nr:gp24 [Klebsiella pneumoniae]
MAGSDHAKQRADEPGKQLFLPGRGRTNLIRNADTLEGWSSRHATETYLGDRVAYTRLAKGASGYTQLDEQTLDVTGRTEFCIQLLCERGL